MLRGSFIAMAAIVAAFIAISDDQGAAPQSDCGHVVVPPSSVAKPGDAGVRAHTNTLIYRPCPTRELKPPKSGGNDGDGGAAPDQGTDKH
jgi:hypothetical protein